jgi:hypothetical protein
MVDADTVTADVAPMRAGELMAAESLAAQATQVERALMAAEPAGLRLAEADIAAAVWVAAGTLVAAAFAVAAEAIWVAEASMVAAADTAAADTGKCSGFSWKSPSASAGGPFFALRRPMRHETVAPAHAA